MSPLFKSLFEPAAVALVGASADRAKAASRPLRYLRKHGFGGAIHLVNPARREIDGAPVFASVRDIPGAVDHAFVMTPAREVARVLDDCIAARVPLVTVYSDGFADVGGEGVARQNALVAAARTGGVRLLGPNSMGTISPISGIALTVNTVMESVDLRRGSTALVSQSGSMIGSLLSRAQARGHAFSRLVAVGNEADLGVGEVVDLLVDDPATQAILLFLEAIRAADELARAARRAYDAGKPVIAYKLGHSEAARDLAAAHSGALAGPRENATAFFRHHGIVEVDCFESLFEIVPLARHPRRTAGRRVAVLTNTGGGAAVVADGLGRRGLDLVQAPERLVERIATFGIRVGHGPIVDVTAAGTRPEIYEAALEELMASDCDLIVVIVGSTGMSNPDYAVAPVRAVRGAKPIVAFAAPEATRALEMLLESGVAAFRTPEACADSVAAYLAWTPPRPVATDRAGVDDAARALDAASGPTMNEAESRAVFAALGIRQAGARLVTSADEARSAGVRFPVAAKIVSPDIAHKSEAGGVALDLRDADALAAAADRMRTVVAARHPEARIVGVLVQEMHAGLAEAIVGYKRDPEVGPVVILGVGGVLSEVYRDMAVRIAPVDREEALDMIAEVRGLAPIRGYRNLPRGDLAALADAVCAVSRLALIHTPVISEAEINPLIVKGEGQGVVAVDALIVLRTDENPMGEHA